MTERNNAAARRRHAPGGRAPDACPRPPPRGVHRRGHPGLRPLAALGYLRKPPASGHRRYEPNVSSWSAITANRWSLPRRRRPRTPGPRALPL